MIRLAALALMACGRIAFEPRDDASSTGTSDGDGAGDGDSAGGTSIKLVAHTLRNGMVPAGLTTAPIDTTGASLFALVECTYNGGTPAPPTDSAGNTWVTGLPAYGAAMNPSVVKMFYTLGPVTSAAHTFTVPGSDFLAIAVLAFGGVAAFDGAVGISGVMPSRPGPLIPTQTGELAVTFACSGQSTATMIAIDSGFTLVDSIANNNTSAPEDLASAYLVSADTNPVDPAWTFTGDTKLGSVLANFTHP